MTKSLVVELWARKSGVVGIYRVHLRRSWAQALTGGWTVAAIDLVEGAGSPDACGAITVMVEHSIQDMNGWLLRVL